MKKKNKISLKKPIGDAPGALERRTMVTFQNVVLGEDPMVPSQETARQGRARPGRARQGKTRQGESGQVPPQTEEGSREQELCFACSWGSQLQSLVLRNMLNTSSSGNKPVSVRAKNSHLHLAGAPERKLTANPTICSRHLVQKPRASY